MIRMIYFTCVLMLIGAGTVLWTCAGAWAEGATQSRSDASGMERLPMVPRPSGGSAENIVPPLVEQATAFAAYLKPPAPPVPKEVPKPKPAVQPVPRPPVATPQFRLLATSCCLSSPEKSLALIAEPGKGDRWTRPGERLGHLVIESVENGMIVYRDGSQRHEMAVTMKKPVELGRLASSLSASARNIRPTVGLRTPSPLDEGQAAMPAPP